MEFASVTLDGSSSTDVDGEIIEFEWSQVGGPNVTLSSLTAVSPTFEAPNANSLVELIFNLKVTDNDDATDEDQVTIFVKDDDEKDDDEKDNEVEIEVEVKENIIKVKVKIDDDEFKFTLDGGLSDEEIIEYIADEFDLDPKLVAEIIEIQREDNDDNEDKKVTICHVPPGNSGNYHTIRIGESAVDAHLAHGDSMGECDDDIQELKENKSNSEKGNSGTNSGKGNQKDKDEDDKKTKNNSGKGNQKDKDEDDEKTKSNSGKGNQKKLEKSDQKNKDEDKDEDKDD